MKELPSRKRGFFKILVCLLAILALLTTFTYIILEIVSDANEANRLMLETFLEREDLTSQTTAADTESAAADKTPIIEEPKVLDVTPKDLSAPTLQLQNETSYVIDEDACLSTVLTAPFFDTRPMIVVYHSDPTEAYLPEELETIAQSSTFSGGENTVVKVGQAIVETLEAIGITAIHITECDDLAETLLHYKTVYPSVAYFLDIRRDGIYTEDGNIIKSAGKLNERTAAQLLLTAGVRADGKTVAWQKDLAFAFQLADQLTSVAPSLTRPVLLESERVAHIMDAFNLTLSVGTSGNTLDEAILSARFFAKHLAIYILSHCAA